MIRKKKNNGERTFQKPLLLSQRRGFSLAKQIGAEKIAMKMVDYHVKREIDGSIANLSLDLIEYTAKDMALHMKARVATDTVKKLKYPKDWREAVKERWFPKWLLQKYPVKYDYIQADVLYPLIAIPEEQAFVQIHKFEGGFPNEY